MGRTRHQRQVRESTTFIVREKAVPRKFGGRSQRRLSSFLSSRSEGAALGLGPLISAFCERFHWTQQLAQHCNQCFRVDRLLEGCVCSQMPSDAEAIPTLRRSAAGYWAWPPAGQVADRAASRNAGTGERRGQGHACNDHVSRRSRALASSRRLAENTVPPSPVSALYRRQFVGNSTRSLSYEDFVRGCGRTAKGT